MRAWLCLLLAFVFTACSSFQITNFEMLTNKDGRVVYRIDGMEDTFFSERPMPAIICVPDSQGDLQCR